MMLINKWEETGADTVNGYGVKTTENIIMLSNRLKFPHTNNSHTLECVTQRFRSLLCTRHVSPATLSRRLTDV